MARHALAHARTHARTGLYTTSIDVEPYRFVSDTGAQLREIGSMQWRIVSWQWQYVRAGGR